MESIKRQASKLREQVAKQQQAVLKQLGHFGSDAIIADEAELHCHEQLQNLYDSTRAAKHFQKDLVRGVENFVTTSSKQMEIVQKLAEDCFKYGSLNPNSDSVLANPSLDFGASHSSVEKEREIFLKILGAQVCEPLRASIRGAPLEDARHLTHHYDRIRHEVEVQAAEVAKRQLKYTEAKGSESSTKLHYAEAKLTEMKSTMMALGREATAAMSSVYAQQQHLTLQQLVTMVDAERCFHQNASAILEKLHSEMILEKQRSNSDLQPTSVEKDLFVPDVLRNVNSNGSGDLEPSTQEETSFIAQVIHPFDAQAFGELSLSFGDAVVVHQVSPNGWSEGECNGKAGWFPSAYIERKDKALGNKFLAWSSTSTVTATVRLVLQFFNIIWDIRIINLVWWGFVELGIWILNYWLSWKILNERVDF
ncbi:hypothetical protein AQUCO_02600404v1 [Aquilegia coerulea]|uniref:SH3 domain-containing protein n=1 Tax=Aquilegia coerulea TaxID=218851 RepID=A0A2G5D8U3_AQUCA|nr:hypothetical protein AQUCO_02600404v1 [Aquilegia coerulea]